MAFDVCFTWPGDREDAVAAAAKHDVEFWPLSGRCMYVCVGGSEKLVSGAGGRRMLRRLHPCPSGQR